MPFVSHPRSLLLQCLLKESVFDIVTAQHYYIVGQFSPHVNTHLANSIDYWPSPELARRNQAKGSPIWIFKWRYNILLIKYVGNLQNISPRVYPLKNSLQIRICIYKSMTIWIFKPSPCLSFPLRHHWPHLDILLTQHIKIQHGPLFHSYKMNLY